MWKLLGGFTKIEGDLADHSHGANTFEGRVVRPQPRWEHPAQRSFWHSLDAVEREAFVAAAKEVSYWSGTTLCRQDDITSDVIVIRAGWTKVTVEIDGHLKIIAVRGPGDTVGERAAIMAAPRSATVIALDDVRALVVPAAQFRALLTEHPHILEVLKRQEHERLTEDAADPATFARDGVERRLAGLLLELALRRGEYAPDGSVTITLPMSYQELSEWADAKPEAVSWFLNEWRQRGIIQSAEHRVTVVDAVGLEKICGSTAVKHLQPPASTWGGTPWAPLNYSIFFTDIAGFGDPRRDDDDRRVVRDALYRMLREAFEGSNVPWDACVHEDRGDGILTVIPAVVSTISLVDPLLALLAAKLRRYNRQAGDPIRIQLRAALHVGPVFHDAQGLSGQALIHTARMLEAPALKEAVKSTGADLAFIASTHVYDTVIRQSPGLVDPATYKLVPVEAKEARTTGWMFLSGGSVTTL